jgi:hypothetical protein
VSSVGSSTRGLETSLEVALESVGRSVLGWAGFIGGELPDDDDGTPKHVGAFD